MVRFVVTAGHGAAIPWYILGMRPFRPVGNSSHFVKVLSLNVWRSPGITEINFKIAVTKKLD